MRKATNECIKMIKDFEGCVLHSYKCDVNEAYYTIGFGHYGISNANVTIDDATAEQYLLDDLEKCYEKIEHYDKIYNFTTNEYDALVSFCFNIGSIDRLTANGTRSKTEIANHMLAYVHCGDIVLDGLVNRRNIEHNLFVNGEYPSGATVKNEVVNTKKINFSTTLDEIVDMIIAGDFGNGDMRKEKLYDTVQDLVNYRLGVY